MSSRSTRSKTPRGIKRPISPQPPDQVEEVATPKRKKMDVFSDLKYHSNRKVITLDSDWHLQLTQQKLLKLASPVSPPTPSRRSVPVEEATVENWDWFYTVSGIRWELTEESEMENLKNSFCFNVKVLTGKQLRVSAQPLRRGTSRSIQFRISCYSVKDGRLAPVPMVAITIEHYRSTRATFQFQLLDPVLAKKHGLKLEVLMRTCGIAFKFQDRLVRRTPEDEVMEGVEDVLEGVMLGVEEKIELEEKEAAELRMGPQVHSSAHVPLFRGRPILLPDRCAIL